MLPACKPKQAETTDYIEPQCLPEQSVCEIDTKFGPLAVLFNVKKVQAEVPFTISIVSDNAQELLEFTGYIEGKNMFMGKVPVFFQVNDKNQSQVDAETLLASCAEDIMTWRLWLTVKPQKGSKDMSMVENLTTVFVDFTSSRY